MQIFRQKYTECVICLKTLGADSREENQLFCHEHRHCTICGCTLSVYESRLCLDIYEETLNKDNKDLQEGEKEIPNHSLIDVECIRCRAIKHAPTITIKQTEYDYLNLIRLMVEPNMDLNTVSNENVAWGASARLVQNMNLEQKLVHLSMMQSLVAQLSVAVRQDPNWRKDALKDRDKKKYDTASREALTSTRPVTKAIQDPQEIELGQFMKEFGLSERKPALKLLSDVKKAINGWVKTGSPPALAEKLVIEGLIEAGRLTRVTLKN